MSERCEITHIYLAFYTLVSPIADKTNLENQYLSFKDSESSPDALTFIRAPLSANDVKNQSDASSLYQFFSTKSNPAIELSCGRA